MPPTPAMRDFMTDGHIALRCYQLGDEFALFDAVHESIAELARWGFYHPAFTLEDAKKDAASRIADWTAGKAFTYLIEQRPEAVFIGNCGIAEFEPERKHAALGWWVRASQTNQGIATRAGYLVARAAFEDLHLDTLSIYTRFENTASRRVAEKLGAVLTRIQPEADGRDTAVYTLKPDYLHGVLPRSPV